ncbi:phosphate binding protein [Rippkaea orientalis PCC 8801]|uniref:Phosphate-binding protein n=1 Tax=Rippkaea orientalis (strain PCC 8801 / RF-1) TaxID=41431 RepID=B7JZ58_RIPO1|nr:PstS family phosphate ABC transporter substrate-binding protein [Rippkaea orientalis]ACK67269.1 phosphate binding protein [Rippkaea orientalis PCC 8801]
MEIPIKCYFLNFKRVGVAIASLLMLPACSQVSSNDIKPIKVDGSSTVYPITQAVLKAYQQQPAWKQVKDLSIEDNFSGTGGGFKKFCDGETDINAASRPIMIEEMAACNQNQVRYIEIPIAFDALTVVVNPKNNWTNTLTVTQLQTAWEAKAEGKITQWNQVDPTYPNNPLNLYGPDKKSGTYDYFREAVLGPNQDTRQDYVFSADDEALVNGVSQDPNALAYFGYAYYEQNQDKLKAVGIDNGQGGVLPSRETVEANQYKPLTRPLFIYVNAKRAQENPALEDFVKFYLEAVPELVTQVGYIPLSEEGYHLAKIQFQRFEVGTVFDGKPQIDLTIGELLRKQAKFQ